MRFFCCSDNKSGVKAVMAEDHWKTFKLVEQCDGDPGKANIKIMCFCPPDKINGKPPRYIAGTTEQLNAMLKKGNHTLVDGENFRIPFSPNGNGASEEQEKDWKYIPTAGEVAELFKLI